MAHSGRTAQRKNIVVPLQVMKQGKQVLALVPVKINGAGPYTFALDTGASRSLVDSQLAAKLHVKKVGRFWSVRVGLHYRALAVEEESNLVWFWIGPHADYDKLLGRA